jgi:hypothetical protein
LTGTFRADPPPDGAYRARLTSPREIAPGVRARLLPGGTPGLLVENGGPEELTVLDADGVPFLRIGPAGVEANVRSRAWRVSGRRPVALGGGEPATDGVRPGASSPASGPSWQRVASTPRYGWIDARLSPGGSAVVDVEWRVPVLLGTTRLEIAGVSSWKVFGEETPNAPPIASR